jgi:ankyrin repeat protein
MEFVEQADDMDTPETANIWVASSDGDVTRVLQLLQQGVSINAQDEYGYSPIHAAVSYGHKELIEALISGGADLNLRDPDGDTPLLSCEESEIFELLVRGGADPRARNNAGQGLFEKAVEDENVELAQYLLDNGYVENVDPRVMVKLTNMLQDDGGGEMDGIQEGDEEEEDDADDDNAEAERNINQIMAAAIEQDDEDGEP